MSEDLKFADETSAPIPASNPWLVLVVDDDVEVHAVTRLALQDCMVEGRPLRLLNAHSAQAAKQLLRDFEDIGLILLDVVMESEHAGLELVRHVREVMGNTTVRIVLRTGQPGQAPARDVLGRYEIDDYRIKTELNFERLHVLVTTALRTYRMVGELAQKNLALSRSNQELEQFAYVASHDLQTPLRGIISFTQLLATRYDKVLDDEAREYMQFIVSGGRDMQRLINDLLQYSRVGHSHADFAPVDLNQVLAKAVGALAAATAARAAEITVLPMPTVFANAVQMEQLFRNLFDNALKFQPQEKPWIKVTATTAGQRWRIVVEDGGIGIAAAYLDQIFEVFVRLHSQEEYPGTGVGLAICRKIARLHGGDLQVESTPGTGTRMIVTLPLAG